LAACYLETSALVKRYIREAGTERTLSLLRDPDNTFATLSVTQVEFRSAIRRREKNGDLPSRIADHLLDLFQIHTKDEYTVLAISPVVIDLARAIVDRHILRGYDALQLAAYLAFKVFGGISPTLFVCSDRALLRAATLEGADVVDVSV
jgi:predicted nucleic acid-binding protein